MEQYISMIFEQVITSHLLVFFGKIKDFFRTLSTQSEVTYVKTTKEDWKRIQSDKNWNIQEFSISEDIAIKASESFYNQHKNFKPQYFLLHGNCGHRTLEAFGLRGSPSPLPAKQGEWINRITNK